MTIRPPWAKLWAKKSRDLVDYSVSPVHDIEDEVDPPVDPGDLTPTEALFTGITTEHPTSEQLFNDLGDALYHGN